MGTIVAARTSQSISIGADALNTFEEIVHPSLNRAESCITKVGEAFVGLNCSYALQQASLTYFSSLSPEALSDIGSADKQALYSFFSAHFQHLRIQYQVLAQHQPNIPFETLPMNALVINRYGLFKVDATRTIYEHRDYWALGSGETFALGALHALHDDEADSETLVQSALRACGTFEANRGREVFVRTIPLPNLKLARADKEKESHKGKVLLHRGGPVSIRRGKKSKKREQE